MKLFFIFDPVHLFKCIRNNWLNIKDPIQTFLFPSFDDYSCEIMYRASFKTLKILYDNEKNSIIKHAPGLSEKVLYPSNMERQNVNYVVKLFDIKNVAALQTHKISNYEPVCDFMDIIIK